MNNPYFDLLMWARGPGFDVALTIMVGGILLRLVEIFVLGRKKDLAAPKGNGVLQGLRTVFTRSVPRKGAMKEAPVTYIAGYLFHIGFFVAFLFLGAHIALIGDLIGIQWPAANKALIEIATAIAVVALIALLWTRFKDPVRRALSTFDDYLVWVLSILPLVTGYAAVNTMFGDSTLMMAIHMLSAEALMIAFPFTKLMHAVTFAVSRYYNGSIQGRKGAES
jgi:nitrate reductase gamma subunit